MPDRHPNTYLGTGRRGTEDPQRVERPDAPCRGSGSKAVRPWSVGKRRDLCIFKQSPRVWLSRIIHQSEAFQGLTGRLEQRGPPSKNPARRRTGFPFEDGGAGQRHGRPVVRTAMPRRARATDVRCGVCRRGAAGAAPFRAVRLPFWDCWAIFEPRSLFYKDVARTLLWLRRICRTSSSAGSSRLRRALL